MRVAFVGKGGAGKSAIAGTFCRLLARSDGQGGEPMGEPTNRDGPSSSPAEQAMRSRARRVRRTSPLRPQGVVAIDSDPLPGLAISLGIPSRDTPLPPELVEKVGEDPDATWRLRSGTTVLDVLEQHAPAGPDGVRLLQFGKLRGHVRFLGPSQQAFRVVVRELAATDVHLVGDLPGGTRQAFFGWAGFADVLVVVAEATPSSMLSARRLAHLAGGDERAQLVVAVANKTVDPDDARRLAEFSGLRVIGAVPRDPAVGAAERAGVPVLDSAPESPAVEAVASLVDALVREAP